MNSKAIKKQLLAAVAMVLVAAVALGSSTYAWFVASGTVTATGMKVQAMSEGGLAISYGGQDWATTASAGMTSRTLYPVSTADTKTWVHASAHDPNASAAEEGTYQDVTAAASVDADTNHYVVKKEFKIRSTAKDDNNLAKGLFVKDIQVKLADETSDPTQRLSTALRVAVQYTDTTKNVTTTHIFGPVKVGNGDESNSATSGYMVHNADGTPNQTVTLKEYSQNTSALLSVDQKITNSTDGIPVQIYIWYEGEDNNLFSNIFAVEGLSISVDFSSISNGTNGNNP